MSQKSANFSYALCLYNMNQFQQKIGRHIPNSWHVFYWDAVYMREINSLSPTNAYWQAILKTKIFCQFLIIWLQSHLHSTT